ncbi:DUF1672 domain-containing protein [Sporolactobacillus sp. STSJ-5]|uniref:DUF1672 family protein n=1 Tax=Sporolactobacillus sp. STSJ-5 TaxID=2965076 RepID=UPI0021078191|nr:DUF1672 family protein [Sporolactobacillus sp. STSJ-5]MCQ2009648.1 DUF1672 domain-containing protein [Sporolactobacillus sp. STSJ-5]
MDNDQQSTSATKKEQEKQYESSFISVQKYTGQGYSLDGGEENDKIAEAHRNEVVKAVKKFFLKKYKTKVKVHNLVGNRDGVTVFVESVGEPNFHTFAVVPISSNKEIKANEVFSQKGQVEDAIRSGIYAMIYDKELKNLDLYLSNVAQNHALVGLRQEVLDRVTASGYTTPFYSITVTENAFEKNLNQLYLKNPNWEKKDWKEALANSKVNPKLIFITLQLFMKDQNKNPDREAFNEIVAHVKKTGDVSPGAYSILLHNNRISKSSGRGSENHMLERSNPNEINKP